MDYAKFVDQQIASLRETVGSGLAINALSGGVDSSVVTALGHRALGDRLKTVFIDNALMREGEPQRVVQTFAAMGIPVELVDARDEFLAALRGLTDPEDKRNAITGTFYSKVFGRLVRQTGARFLLHGTILTDIEETVAGIKRQHNVLAQLGINTEEQFGYTVLEPIIQLRKPAVRIVAKAMGLPPEIFKRPPFPGPALAARVIGEVTPERAELVRKATVIVEAELKRNAKGAFQYFAILHPDKVTGLRNGKRDYGWQIEVRCWDSKDARIGSPTKLPWSVLMKLSKRLTTEVPGVVSVTYNIATKPPSTIEAV